MQTICAFQLGKKVAIAFPRKFGIKLGQKFKVTKDSDIITLTPTN